MYFRQLSFKMLMSQRFSVNICNADYNKILSSERKKNTNKWTDTLNCLFTKTFRQNINKKKAFTNHLHQYETILGNKKDECLHNRRDGTQSLVNNV